MNNKQHRQKALPWFRFYISTLNSSKIQSLPDWAFRGWVNILCCAGIHDGALPATEQLAFELRLTDTKTEALVDFLKQRKLLDVDSDGRLTPHEWNKFQYVSDLSTGRVKKYREKQSETVSETTKKRSVKHNETVSETASDTDTDTEEIQIPPTPLPGGAGPREAEAASRSSTQSSHRPASLIERDLGWEPFQEAWGHVCEVHPSEPDWQKALDAWRPLSGEQKISAVRWLQQLAQSSADDPARRSLPVNFLRNRIFERVRNTTRAPVLTTESKHPGLAYLDRLSRGVTK